MAVVGQYWDWHLAIRHRQQKKCIQVNGGSRKKLTAVRRCLICCARPAPHKGHCCQGLGKNNIIQVTTKDWNSKRGIGHKEMHNDICNRGLRDLLCLGNIRAFKKAVRQSLGMEVAQGAVESSSDCRK